MNPRRNGRARRPGTRARRTAGTAPRGPSLRAGRPRRLGLAAGLAATAAMTLAAAAPAAASHRPTQAAVSARVPGNGAPKMQAACSPAGRRQARCYALYAPQASVNAAIAAQATGRAVPPGATTPSGWGATDIESAYKLPVWRTPHATVAVVDAYSTPDLAADLGVYRKHYGLPPCTTATGCLRIVNQHGHPSPLPQADPTGWGVEETLDVDMASAACPHCQILVVEASSASIANLATADNTAARLGAAAISNSYGAPENGFTQAYAAAYHHPGHVITASSGDSGFTPASFPANLATVTAVGGTQLSRAKNARGWSEKVWNNPYGASGSGCSAYVAKPAWQHDPHCPGRTIADVAALAWNIPVYDSSLGTQGPWLSIGGTSASSPLIAAVYALAGNAATATPGYPYAHPGALYDITTGNNDWSTGTGSACGYDYLCVAKKSYDAPTGLGTPNGTAAF
jgi:subtilase family serine protease